MERLSTEQEYQQYGSGAGTDLTYYHQRRASVVVTALKDGHTYPTRLKVTDEELAPLNLFKDAFHGEWNYTINPQVL